MSLHRKHCDEEQGEREEGVSGRSELAHEWDVGAVSGEGSRGGRR